MKTRTMDTNVAKSPAVLRTLIRSLPDGAFDGHTAFDSLGPEQRLDWLSQAVRFVWEAKKARSASSRKQRGAH